MSITTICIGGKHDIAVEVLTYCLKHYRDLYRIICIPDRNDTGQDTWQSSVKGFCGRTGIETVSLSDVYGIQELLFLSVEFDRIVDVDRFASDNLFNIHFSLLPKYKGMFPSVLPILDDEQETGVTLHRIRKGIDTGEIIEQRRFPIEDDDTSYDLYRKLSKLGAEVVCSSLDRLLSGDFTCTPQPVRHSSYHPKGFIDYSDLEMPKNMTADQYNRTVRAYAFRPYQFIQVYGHDIVECFCTDRVSDAPPGIVISENDTVMEVSTIDYDVILYKDVLDDIIGALKANDRETVQKLCVSKKILEELKRLGLYQTWMSASV